MCILCVVQKWSRRVATMLPWLVIPLIGLWALSQLLPPGFQFEVTSPRLACVMVLLITLFWYEVLMPQLSAWRVRRNARLRERRRLEAMELQKLRKTATRRCRNCHMPYRDQNPGGGRFMCSYCGHISKRPVLDIRGSAVSGLANSGIGKILNGKVWSENGWICGQDWPENGNWGPSFEANSSHWGKNGTKSGTGFFSGDDRYSAERSYLGLVPYACKLLSSFFLSVRWLWRKIFRVTSSRDVDLLDAENKRLLSKKGENGANFPESRGERARRKAEEKRQARIEKELLEEEERKQREEVARLVEERRKLRDEKLEAEKERDKGSTPDRERDYRRDAERRRHERRKEKDRGSSKSNSDGEELEKKANRVSERKREFDKRSDVEKRDASRTAAESGRSPISEGHAMKNNINSFNRVSGSGSRYFDHMKGSFLSSTKAFNGAGFFGRGTQNSAPAGTKVNRPAGPVELQASVNRRGVHSAEHLSGKLTANGDNKITQIASHRPVGSDLQQFPIVQKKSWQQLFTHSSTLPSLDASNTIYQQSQNYQLEPHNPQLPDQSSSGYHLDRQNHFGIPLLHPIASLYDGSMSNVAISPPGRESVMPHVGGSADDFMSDEAELYEDPCYVPDPVSLIGPVSESLDNFSLDLGAGFISNAGLESSHVLKNVSASVDVSKPAPIESPFSRSRVSEERHVSSSQPQYTPKLRDAHTSLLNESNSAVEQGTWQMWGTPLGHDGLGLGGPASWILPLGQNKTNLEEILHPSSNEAMPSQFAMEKSVINGTPSPQNIHVSGCQNGGSYSPLGTGSNDNDIWLHNTLFQPLSGDAENPFPPNPQKDLSQNEVTRDSPSKPAAINLFQPSATNSWSKRDWAVPEGEGNDGHSTLAIPHIGGLFSTPDVQSLWSFK